jgi:hypothetical protein
VNDHYPDGQLYAELRGTTGEGVETSEVLAQFLRAFGVPRVPETTQERLTAYRTLLAGRRVLAVLDDASDGDQVSDLVPANPRCGVLVTARQRLPEVSGAHHVPPLEPLRPAYATELFLHVVQDAGISLENELDAVGRVVTLCGGWPLALRIAGALRVQAHPRPTAELVDRLTRQGPAAFTYKNLNLARTIGAGFERLDSAARELFLGLGLLPLASFGQWTAAALLAGTDADPAAALSQLAASFMAEMSEPDLRYRFHDLTREYARRRASAEYPGEPGAAPARVYRALLTLVRNAHIRLYGGDYEVIHSNTPGWDAPPEVLAEVDTAPLEWFEKERSNIRAAVEHCATLGLTGLCWDLAVSAHEFYKLGGACGVAQQWWDKGLRRAAPVQSCRTACLGQALGAGRQNKSFGMGDLAAEVARVKRHAPDHLIDVAQVPDGECVPAERRGQRGVFEACPGPLYSVVQDAGVVEGQCPAYLLHRSPASGLRVRPGRRNGQIRGDREVGHADHPASGVTVRGTVGGQLLQMQGIAIEAGLLAKLTCCRLAQTLTLPQEPARQRVPSPVWLIGPLDDQYLKEILPDGQYRQVDGEAHLLVVAAGHAPSIA